jgi:hypothetical protein
MFLLRQRSGEPAARQRRTVPPVVRAVYRIGRAGALASSTIRRSIIPFVIVVYLAAI